MSARLNARETSDGKPLLHKDKYSQGIKCVWNYREAVGVLGYLQVSTQPEILTNIYQCALFFNNPRLLHERAIIRIEKYPASMSTYVDLPEGN